MSAVHGSGKRICPECGYPNGGISLFCAECGASLSDATVDGADNQTTTAFTPVSTGQKTSSRGGAEDPNATAGFRPEPDTGTSNSKAAWQHSTSAWQEPVDTSPDSTFYETESRRGLVLGWIASLLIVLVVGFFIWSSILSQNVRDSFTGFF